MAGNTVTVAIVAWVYIGKVVLEFRRNGPYRKCGRPELGGI